MNLTKRALGSRTVRLAVLQGVVGVLTALMAADPTYKYVGWIATAKAVIDILLRFDTQKPVGEP